MNKRFLPLAILSAFLFSATVASAQTTKKENTPSPSLGSVKITDPKSSDLGGKQTIRTGSIQPQGITPILERTGTPPRVENKNVTAVKTPTNSAGVADAKQNTKEAITKSNVYDATINYVAPKKVVYGADGAILKDTPKK